MSKSWNFQQKIQDFPGSVGTPLISDSLKVWQTNRLATNNSKPNWYKTVIKHQQAKWTWHQQKVGSASKISVVLRNR